MADNNIDKKSSRTSKIAKGVGKAAFYSTPAGMAYGIGKSILKGDSENSNTEVATPPPENSQNIQDNPPPEKTQGEKKPSSRLTTAAKKTGKTAGKVYMYTSPGAFIVGKLLERRKERRDAQSQVEQVEKDASQKTNAQTHNNRSENKPKNPNLATKAAKKAGKAYLMATPAYWIHKFAAKNFPNQTQSFDSFFAKQFKKRPTSKNTQEHKSEIDYIKNWNKKTLTKTEPQRTFIKDHLQKFLQTKTWKYGKYVVSPGSAISYNLYKKMPKKAKEPEKKDENTSFMRPFGNKKQETPKPRVPGRIERYAKSSGKAIYKYTTPAGQAQTLWNKWGSPHASSLNNRLGRRFGNVASPRRLGGQAAKKIGSQLGKTAIKQAALAFFKTPPGWITLGVIALIFLFIGVMYMITTVLSGGRGNGSQTGSATPPSVSIPAPIPKPNPIPGFTISLLASPSQMDKPEEITYTISYTYNPPAGSEITLDQITIYNDLPQNTQLIDSQTTGNFQIDSTGRKIAWPLSDTENQSSLTLVLLPTINNAKIENVVYGQTFAPGGGMIDTSSQNLAQIFQQSAQAAGVPTAMIKAIAKKESGVLSFTDEDVAQFNTLNWFVGLVDNAPNLSGNDPLIIKGYGYNTCLYVTCFAGADVRGAMQFEINTWNGIKSALTFSDGHDPDRRYVRDVIYGTGEFLARSAQQYDSRFNFSQNPTNWTEEQVRALARTYCGGNPDADVANDGACTPPGGTPYDILVWQYYQEFKALENL